MATIYDRFNFWIEDRLQGALAGLDPYRDARVAQMEKARDYRYGKHPKSVKTREGMTDDNITVNFTGLLVDRATSLLFGDGVEFDLPGEGDSEAQVYIDRVWELNKKHELLIDISDDGATFGTPCLHIKLNAIDDDGKAYPEIKTIDPRWLTIETDPENYRKVKQYVIEYRIKVGDELRQRRIEIAPNMITSAAGVEVVETWEQRYYLENDNGQMQLEETLPWEFPFPPILPFKNLPMSGVPTGRPDLTDDVIEIQDAVNRVATSTNKAIRLTAFQRLWGKFLKNFEVVGLGMDKIMSVDNEKAELNAIDSGTDFNSMIAFQNELRDAMFTIARSADPSVLKDKVGELTNFGLRVLFKDAIDKLKTKRKLYGEALKELNRRLLILNDMEDDPGEVVWAEPLPSNEIEETAGYKFDLENGLASKDTIREKRGYDSDEEKERIQAERNEDGAEPEVIDDPETRRPIEAG